MEELRKLERLQTMLTLLDSHGLSSGVHLHSDDRFLAQLLLFLLQPCGELSVENKCSLAMEFLNKITPEVMDKLKCFEVDETDQGEAGAYSDPPAIGKEDDKTELDAPKFSEMPLICLDSMQRANSTLEDFPGRRQMPRETNQVKIKWIC